MEPSWPEWGASPPPHPHYEKQYFRGPQGDMHAGEVLYEQDAIKVLRCHPCICIHLWPLSTPEALAQYYREQFYQTTKPAYLAHYQEDQAWWLATHRTILDAASPWLTHEECVTMLDIGAGPGHPLRAGMERGYQTLALEVSPVAAAWLRHQGHLVYECTLADFAHNTNAFHLLYAYEVLEHQANPEEFLLHCYDVLLPGGVLVVAVPSDWTTGQLDAMRRFNLSPWFLAIPDHQYYFSPVTLKLMARRCGFSLRHMRMTYPMIEEFLLTQARCYVNNPVLGRICHQERVKYELGMIRSGGWPELEAMYIANVERRVGREIIGIFTKDQ